MKHLQIIKSVIVFALIALAVWTVWNVTAFIFGDSWTAWGLGQILWLFVSLLKYVFFATIFYLIPPILIYWVLLVMLKNPFIRAAAGIGCVYLFWVLGGGSSILSWSSFSAPIDTALKIIRMSLQIYLLIILVMPSELMSIIGTIASIIGSIVIYFFPDAPGALDDIAAVCTLISMVFVYLNTLAMILKQHSGKVIDKISELISRKVKWRNNNETGKNSIDNSVKAALSSGSRNSAGKIPPRNGSV